MKRLRILPATIITAALLLGVKVVSAIHDTQSLLIGNVEAQQADKASNVSTEKPANMPDQGASAKPDDKKTEEKKPDDKQEAGKADEKKPDDKSAEDKKTDEKKPEGEGAKSEGKKENPHVSKELESSTDHRFTAVEVELLQSLSKRREELERWENNIQIKESALDATEKRIDDKIKQIDAMKKQVALLLAQYNTQEDAKIHSLVKIYENMKPADAARIFDEVEMPILLLVIDSMAEKKAAPILAAMNPKKAKQLTVELANERKINTKITTGVESQLAAGATPAPSTAPDASATAPAPAPTPAPDAAAPAAAVPPPADKPSAATADPAKN